MIPWVGLAQNAGSPVFVPDTLPKHARDSRSYATPLELQQVHLRARVATCTRVLAHMPCHACRDLGNHRRHPTYHRAARRSMSGSQPRSRQPSRALTCCNPFSNPCSPLLQIFNAPTTAAVAAVVPTVTAVATTTAADAHAVGGPIPYGILSTAPRLGIDPPHLAPAVAPTTTPTTTLPYHRPGRLRPKQLPRPPR